MEKLTWLYPIKAFTVINAINKATPFVLECMVRKRLEKRMEVVLNNVTTYASGRDRSALKLRSITPASSSSTNSAPRDYLVPTTELNGLGQTQRRINNNNKNGDNDSPNSLIVLGGETTNLGSEFVHSVQFSNNGSISQEASDMAKNSIAMRLVRVHRDKSNGLVTLLFDVIFSPSRSFM